MLKLDRILVPTDFSRGSERALDVALALASRFGAELHLLHAVVLHADDPHDPAHQFPDAGEIRERLDRVMQRPAESGSANSVMGELVVHRSRRRGISVAPTILEHAVDVAPDLIVMSTHGRGGLEGMLLGSVAEEVVRRASCPVLTIGQGQQVTSLTSAPRVLVPVDFSDHSRQALIAARQFADAFGGAIRVLHVFERPIHPEPHLGGTPLDAPEFHTVEPSLREALESFVAETPGPEVPATLHLTEGRPVPTILDQVDGHDIDLVVIATHGLAGLAHVLLGSVTEKVVRRAASPVLTVRAPGRSPLA